MQFVEDEEDYTGKMQEDINADLISVGQQHACLFDFANEHLTLSTLPTCFPCLATKNVIE